MNKKSVVTVLLVFALALGAATLEAYACGYGKAGSHHRDFGDTFSRKVHFILDNEEELGLSEEQVKKIKDLKIKAKKGQILKEAELDVLAVDIKAAMWKDTIDTNAINKLIDKKYELKKEKAKSSLEAYASLKGILTEEQKDKMKELWKKCKGQKTEGSMMKEKMACPMMTGEM